MRILTHSRSNKTTSSRLAMLPTMVVILLFSFSPNNLFGQCDIACPNVAETTVACDEDLTAIEAETLFTSLGGVLTDCGIYTIVFETELVHPGACGGSVVATYLINSDSGTTDVADDVVDDTSCSTTINITIADTPVTAPPASLPVSLTCDEAVVFIATFTDPATYTNSLTGDCLLTGDFGAPTISAMPDICNGGIITVNYASVVVCNPDIILGPLSFEVPMEAATAATLTLPVDDPDGTVITCDTADDFPDTYTSIATISNGLVAPCLISGTNLAPTFIEKWDLCDGGTIEVTWEGLDDCNVLHSHTSTVTVTAAAPIVVTMPMIISGPLTCEAAIGFTYNVPATYTNDEGGDCENEGFVAAVVDKTGFTDACGGTITISFPGGMDACGNPIVIADTDIAVDPAPLAVAVLPASLTAVTSLTCDEAASFITTFADVATYDNGLTGICQLAGDFGAPIFSALPDVCTGGILTVTYADVADVCGNVVAVAPYDIMVDPAPMPAFDFMPPSGPAYACDMFPAPSVIPYNNGLDAASSCYISGDSELSVFTPDPATLMPCGGEIMEQWTIVATPLNCLAADLVYSRSITLNPAPDPVVDLTGFDFSDFECGVDAPRDYTNAPFTNGGTGTCEVAGVVPAGVITYDPAGLCFDAAGDALGTAMVTFVIPAADNCTGADIEMIETVNFVDTTPPEITPCVDITMDVVAGCDASVSFAPPAAVDLCDATVVSQQTAGPVTGSVFPIGSTSVTFVATDCSGNPSLPCTFNIVVQDVTAPTITCPTMPVMINTNPGDCVGTAGEEVSFIGMDDCDDFVITNSVTDPDAVVTNGTGTLVGADFEKGTSMVTYTITEVNDVTMSATCGPFDVTVIDNEAPLCPMIDITVTLDATDMAVVTPADVENVAAGGYSDNCGEFEFVPADFTFSCADLGVNEVEFQIAQYCDGVINGPLLPCHSTVTVMETVAPICVANDITIFLDADGMYTLTPADIASMDGGSSDNCCPLAFSVGQDEFGCDDVAAPVEVLFIVTEDCAAPNANQMSTCVAEVTVVDVTLPTCIAQNITVELDDSGMATIAAEDVDNGSTDECCLSFVSALPLSFTCNEVGLQQVTLTAEDCSGNQASCFANVTVEDNTVPECADFAITPVTAYLDASGSISLSTTDIIDLSDLAAIDACGVGSVTSDLPIAYTCSDVGEQMVTITVVDIFGNESTCDVTITVEDLVAPTCVAPAAPVVAPVGADGTVTLTVADVDGGSFDNCSPIVVTAAPLSFDCDDVGMQSVLMTIADANGATSTCTVMVDVVDQELPTCTMTNLIVYLDATGLASINADDVVVAEDNCCLDPITLDVMDFTCADIALSPVTITATVADCNGNVPVAACEAMITVLDTLAPACSIGEMIVDLDPEECDTDVDFVLPLPIDNCDAAPVVVVIPGQPVTGDIFPSGTTAVLYKVMDADGNMDTCAFNIVVNEFTPDGLACKNINLSLDETCSGVITPIMVLTGDEFSCIENCVITVTDAWGNPVPNEFGPEHVGNTYTYMICCNGLCCWGDVQVDYKLPPKIVCPEDLTIACNALEDVGEYLPVTEFCADGELVLIDEDIVSLECEDSDFLSKVTRTYLARDEFGNESIPCTFDIYLARVDLDLVVCPPSKTVFDNTALSCAGNYPLDENGYPSPYDPATGEGCGVPEYVIPATLSFDDSFEFIGLRNSRDVKMCDLDGDGDLDAFVANRDTDQSKVYINNGNGNFQDNGQNLGVFMSESVALGDIDGDGDKDAILANRVNQGNTIYLNDGTGLFTLSANPAIGSSSSFGTELCDLDGDGDLDLFVVNRGGGGQANNVYTNDGAGLFTLVWSSLDLSQSTRVSLADIDGDGDKDAVVSNDGQDNKVYINNGDATFTDSNQNLGTLNSQDVELCDVDGDGDVDAFIVNRLGMPNEVYLNNGGGAFSNSGQAIGASNSREVELFDMDCDGDKDAFVAENGGPNHVYINDGFGVFTDSGLSIGSSNSFGVDMFDADGDGDLDAIVANRNQENTLWINNTVKEQRLELYPEVSDALCNIYVTYTDTEIPGNSCATKIMRAWTVREWYCGGETTTGCFQIIEIADVDGPSFDCPADMTVTTTENCEGNPFLPSVDVDDTCTGIASYLINHENGSLNTNGGYTGMPIGIHTVTYEVFDSCYNSTKCTMQVTVHDNTEPIALCEQNTVVSISTNGHSIAYATSFDDGSYDDCYIDSIRVRRMSDNCLNPANLLFREKVEFCCNDVLDEEIMVQVRVWDNSGNYNECMVNVNVQDKVPPVLTCLDDVTVDCKDDFDINNLGVTFGYLPVTDNCILPEDLVDVPTDNRNQCGTGNVVRTTTLVDPATNVPQTCTQTISIVNDDPFVFGDIIWPRDTTYNNLCDTSQLHPDLLPPPFNKPTFDDDECELIGYNWDDQVFTFVPGEPACVKIIRTWSVIDWCQQTVNGTYTTWEWEQIIKLENTDAPSFLTGCEFMRVESNDADCASEFVPLEVTAMDVDDCTPANQLAYNWTITFESGDILTGSGSVASGEYPIGMHSITWEVLDLCGNADVCSHDFEVINVKAATPKCVDLVTHLIPMDLVNNDSLLTEGHDNLDALDSIPDGMIDNEMVELWASDFNFQSEHVCGYDLTFSFSPDTSYKNHMFDCSNRPDTTVTMYVTDTNGNQSFCVATLTVLDTNGIDICNSDLVLSIRGEVETEDGIKVNDVEVKLMGSSNQDNTDMMGEYTFDNVAEGENYEVLPVLDINPLNGVSTIDMVHIQRHLLGIQNLGSVYDVIAADANNSESISAQDLTEIKRLILGVNTSFTNNSSWRFVDKNQSFPDYLNPWGTGIHESYSVANIANNMVIDFVGVKIGDIDGSIQMMANGETENRDAVSRSLGYKVADNEVLISVVETGVITGFQFELELADNIAYSIDANLPDFDETNYTVVDNKVRVVYANANGVNFADGETLITINVENNANGITLSESLNAEMYTSDLETEKITLRKIESVDSDRIYNYPNPWAKETVIEFTASANGDATIIFYDVKGSKEYVQKVNAERGLNKVRIPNTYFSSTGVKSYKVLVDNHVFIGKMLLIE